MASSDHEPGHGHYEAGLRGLRGCDLTCAIWGVKKTWKEAFFEVKTGLQSCSATSIYGDQMTSDPTSEVI